MLLTAITVHCDVTKQCASTEAIIMSKSWVPFNSATYMSIPKLIYVVLAYKSVPKELVHEKDLLFWLLKTVLK